MTMTSRPRQVGERRGTGQLSTRKRPLPSMKFQPFGPEVRIPKNDLTSPRKRLGDGAAEGSWQVNICVE